MGTGEPPGVGTGLVLGASCASIYCRCRLLGGVRGGFGEGAPPGGRRSGASRTNIPDTPVTGRQDHRYYHQGPIHSFTRVSVLPLTSTRVSVQAPVPGSQYYLIHRECCLSTSQGLLLDLAGNTAPPPRKRSVGPNFKDWALIGTFFTFWSSY